MTARVSFIGDKLMAVGFALSGARVFTPAAQADAVWSSFQEACEETDLLMISHSHAQLIAAQLSQFQLKTPVPPVLCLPETGDIVAPARTTINAAKTSLGLTQ